MDWSYIQQFHKNPPILGFKRSYELEFIYQNNLKSNKNYEIDLYNRIFGNTDRSWVIMKNEYPYNFIDNTLHYVVWFKNGIKDEILYHLEKLGCIYYENIDSKKTIKSIRHIHLFVNSNN